MGKGFEGGFNRGEGCERKPDEKPRICLGAYLVFERLLAHDLFSDYYLPEYHCFMQPERDIAYLSRTFNHIDNALITVARDEGISLSCSWSPKCHQAGDIYYKGIIDTLKEFGLIDAQMMKNDCDTTSLIVFNDGSLYEGQVSKVLVNDTNYDNTTSLFGCTAFYDCDNCPIAKTCFKPYSMFISRLPKPGSEIS